MSYELFSQGNYEMNSDNLNPINSYSNNMGYENLSGRGFKGEYPSGQQDYCL